MPVRAMKGASAFDSALLSIASDPEGYREKLIEFVDRKAAAEAAEADCKAATVEAERLRAEFVAWRDNELRGIAAAQAANKADVQRNIADAKENEFAAENNANEVLANKAVEAALNSRDYHQAATADKLNAQAEAIEARERIISDREAMCTGREQAIAEREGRFENRLKSFAAGL